MTAGEMELSGEVEGEILEEASTDTLVPAPFLEAVEPEEMEVLEYEEEPLPPLPIPYGVLSGSCVMRCLLPLATFFILTFLFLQNFKVYKKFNCG